MNDMNAIFLIVFFVFVLFFCLGDDGGDYITHFEEDEKNE